MNEIIGPPKKSSKLIVYIILGLLLALIVFASGMFAGLLISNYHLGELFRNKNNFTALDTNCGPDQVCALKPAIYLYPEHSLQATVSLRYDGDIITDIPQYNPKTLSWNVTAEPNGRITAKDGKVYPYIFWEGRPNNPNLYKNSSEGFVVPGQDTEAFLRKVLPQLGLVKGEYEEFIEFWVPRLESNAYNKIHFAGEEYTEEARLRIFPKPDSTIRVFMVTEPLSEPISISPQHIHTPTRTGFTVVEWGGTIL